MSRIAGIIDGLSPSLVSTMLGRMTDADVPCRLVVEGAAALASSEPSNSWFDDGQVVVAFDGLIFNRDEIEVPPEFSDAAAIALLYRRLGVQATLTRLNADFALALFDRSNRKWFVARDRFGVKPMYYATWGAKFAFASRLAGLLCVPDLVGDPRPNYLATIAGGHYRFFDNPPEATPFTNVMQLAPGHMLTVSDTKPSVSCWYSLEDQGDDTRPLELQAEEYRELFRDAVARRLRRIERPAFTLSGGLDSTSVATTAALVSADSPQAYSTVYGGGDYDEEAEILDALEGGRIEWHPVQVRSFNLFEQVQRLIGWHDQPISTVTWLAHAFLCEQVKADGYSGLLGGLGGDEQHAGEYDYFFYFFADLQATKQTERLRHEIASWQEHHDHPIWRKNADVAAARIVALTDPAVAGKVTPDVALVGRYQDALGPSMWDARVPTLDSPFASYLKSHAYNEIFRETMPCCLRASDRNTSAFGLCDIFPFFDHRLVEFAFRVPGPQKIQSGVTKQLLRKAMKGTLPEATRTRIKKTGWNAPADAWFSGKEREPLLDLVHSQCFRERGIYEPTEVTRLIEEHFDIVEHGRPQENHMMFLWQLVNLELWLREIGSESRNSRMREL